MVPSVGHSEGALARVEESPSIFRPGSKNDGDPSTRSDAPGSG